MNSAPRGRRYDRLGRTSTGMDPGPSRSAPTGADVVTLGRANDAASNREKVFCHPFGACQCAIRRIPPASLVTSLGQIRSQPRGCVCCAGKAASAPSAENAHAISRPERAGDSRHGKTGKQGRSRKMEVGRSPQPVVAGHTRQRTRPAAGSGQRRALTARTRWPFSRRAGGPARPWPRPGRGLPPTACAGLSGHGS